DDSLRQPPGLGPLVEAGPEMGEDPVGGKEVQIAPLLPGRDPPVHVATHLAADEVDDAALLREEEPESLQQRQGVRMHGVAASESLNGHVPTREVGPET